MDDADKITVYYDGACPVCRRQRARYETLSGTLGSEIRWFDINGRDAQLQQLGIEPQRALTELHVRTPDGGIHRELDAYILLLQRIPWLKPLAWLIGLPGIRPLLSRLYHYWVQRRLRRSGRL